MKHQSHSDLGVRLGALLQPSGLVLSPSQTEAIVDHLVWVLDTNKTMNLTAITEPESALRLHAVDSLAAFPEIEASPAGALCDIGTGGGFPGFPLAVATGRTALLVDSVGKKSRALQQYLEARNYSPGIRSTASRAEDLAVREPHSFAVVTMRAVSRLPSLVELAAPLLQPGGRLVALKGPVDEEELAAGRTAGRLCGLEMVRIRRISLPEGNESRSIVTFTAKKSPRVSLPRRNGLAQSKPLA